MPASILYKHKTIKIGDAEVWQGGALMDDAFAQDLAQDTPERNSAQISVSSISTDTRTLEKGALFIVLKGDKFDGHAYVELAIEKGASACAVEENPVFDVREMSLKFPHVFFIKSSSALDALQDAARQYRNQFSIPVIGVTGSNGKTTTKNLISSVLSQKYKTVSTKGNLNNHIGLPLTLLSMDPDTEVVVCEAGINHVGEMAALSSILQPTDIVITNIGNAHIEFFGARDAIAREKTDLALHMKAGGGVFVPHDEPQMAAISARLSNIQSSGCMSDSQNINKIALDPAIAQELRKEKFKYIDSLHIMSDVSLAVAIGKRHGIPDESIIKGIISAALESGRFGIRTPDSLGDRLIVIDDTYNANPDSVCASLRAMKSMYPEHLRILVLGELKEQGHFLRNGYAQILETARQAEVSEIFLVGISADDFKKEQAIGENDQIVDAGRLHYFSSKQLCLDVLTTYIEQKTMSGRGRGENNAKAGKKMAVLVKGSRSSKMEDVVAGLLSVF